MTTLLVSFATGGRPVTAMRASAASSMSLEAVGVEVARHVVCWAPSPVIPAPDEIFLPEGTKGECLNASMHRYMQERGDLPDFWLTLDDDVVLSERTVRRLLDIMELMPAVQLLGAMNDYVEPGRGAVVEVRRPEGWHEQVQQGMDFCVGGAVHLIRRDALRYLLKLRGRVYSEDPRREDEEICARLREGSRADSAFACAIALSVPVAVLPDDGVDPGYRGRILAMHGGWDPRLERDARRRIPRDQEAALRALNGDSFFGRRARARGGLIQQQPHGDQVPASFHFHPGVWADQMAWTDLEQDSED